MTRGTLLNATIIIITLVTLSFQPAISQERPGISKFPFGFDLEAQTQLSVWFTSDDDDNEEYTGHAIDYETDAVNTWMVAGALKYRGQSMIGGRIIRPFSNTPEHREILRKTTSAVTSLEDYLIYFDLLGLQGISNNPFIEFISGIRLDYRRNYYTGEGYAVEPSIFASHTGEEIILDVEDMFQFQADFQDWYLSFLKLKVQEGRYIRFGAYKSVLKKPHESILELRVDDTDERRNLIVETKLIGYGGFGRVDINSFYFLLRMGAVKFEPQGDIDEYMLYKSKGSFAMLMDMRWGPQISISRMFGLAPINKIYLCPLFGFLFRADSMNSDTTGMAIVDSELSMDIVLDLSLRFKWIFN